MDLLNQLTSFLGQCCPSYRKLVTELIEKLNALGEDQEYERKKLLNEFSDNYIMPTPLWRERIKYVTSYAEKKMLQVKARQHFYFDGMADHDIGINIYPKRLKPGRETFQAQAFQDFSKEAIAENIAYPRAILNELGEHYKAYSYSPIPEEYFKNFSSLTEIYTDFKKTSNKEKLMLSENIKSTKFFSDNFIPTISMDFFNKDAWKKFIDCMKKCDPKKTLEIYASYCRFFLEDFEMHLEYMNASAIYGPSYVIWKNRFAWEKPIVKVSSNNNSNQHVFPRLRWNPNFLQQRPLPFNLLYYIFSKADPLKRVKFHSICKSFFFEFPHPICHRLECNNRRQDRSFQELSLLTYPEDFKASDLANLYLTNSLYVKASDQYFTSKILLPSLYRCTAKFIDITHQILTWNEILRLIGHGNVESFSMRNVKLESDTPVHLEDLMALLPNIVKFSVDCVHYAPETMKNLSQIKFNNKFSRFELFNLTEAIQPKDLLYFVCKHLVNGGRMAFGCSRQMGNEAFENFRRNFKGNVYKSHF